MKKLIFSFALFMSCGAFAEITIISDLDDTIKITNAGNFGAATYNGIFSEKVFTGIPEFLEEARTYTTGLHVVTASPSIILPDVRETLNENQILFDSLFYRSLRRWESSIPFKIRVIKKILESSTDQVILMGDDVNHDPEVYEEIRQLYPERIAAIYIHVIEGRDLPESSTRYWTSFDLALREFQAGRMDENSVNRVLERLLNVKKMKRIIPHFAQCPSSASPFEWQLQTLFRDRASELITKIAGHCRRGKTH